MTWPNIHTAEFMYDPEDPPGYRAGEAFIDGKRLGQAAGEQRLTVRVFEIPPGESLCPYHYEYNEEWLLVVDGDLELRTPAGNEPISTGQLVCFPVGPAGGHKVTTTGSSPARIMMWSPKADPEVVVYADSDKVAVYTGNPDDNLRFRRKDGNVPYYEGEVEP